MADHIFELFSKPLRVALLAELSRGPTTRIDLLETLGAAESSLDTLLNQLDETGIIRRHRSREFPTHTTIALAPGPGRDLLPPLTHAGRWLARAGFSSLQTQDRKVSRLAAQLAWCWNHRLIDALASGPTSFTHLIKSCHEAASVSAIKAHLRQLATFGLVSETIRNPRKTKYFELTRLGYELIGPLSAFVRWELRHMPGTAERLSTHDVATAIRMACSLIDPAEMRPGRYVFVVNLPGRSVAGLVVEFTPDTWRAVVNPSGPVRSGIRANPLPWLDAIIDLRMDRATQDPERRIEIRPSDCNFIELVHEALTGNGEERSPGS